MERTVDMEMGEKKMFSAGPAKRGIDDMPHQLLTTFSLRDARQTYTSFVFGNQALLG